ncbi:UDP-N-acetylmuramoyl-L-alanyl-D-glutamate--2,6-diaminopimelate ligase [Azorhizobium oxalatiphilum]|uniref:UDP-N-acetylmuramoyl-L-alanyl-D-glutamate--2,6-diaminopimelate ligase n=1 Tax=Azorhizobium oxalatiphilum TaxID=980631 RepID=A0A917FFS5_9HYPH|nr:UDP-N-acetylmuramoyl-L-alanyl-D-glutamate--2,6-diaminopimelate ligase [Azorhizobium oxalatiphilum]GGF80897.1 UDP-N-acetylmuramoyl-L-alanyl-D-glutamate--2,6-diaminopimelate ligase [Azorhizobium oxalatiphilum]
MADFAALIAGHARLERGEAPAGALTGITSDSRKVKPGMLFVAVPGVKVDGARFVPDAVAKGAAAVLMEPTGTPPDVDVPLVFSLDVRRSLALMAARSHARQPGQVVAVTGTAGKTSVAEFLRQIWTHLGFKAAYLGTLGLIAPGETTYGGLTSPDPVDLHAMLDHLAGTGITHMALEASSHGLDQRRLDGVKLTAGGFTNLGRDHLDYHPTVADYYHAKLRLFTELMPPYATAIAALDAPYGATTLAYARTRGLPTFAIGAAGDLKVTEVLAEGTSQRIRFADRPDLVIPLVGRFQADNALLAASLVAAGGVPLDDALAALAHLKGVPGRLEKVGTDPTRPVFVDYAHKPEALETVLDTLRAATPGRLMVVFGCGGDRDRGKRPLMGDIAARKADVVIVTDDNPRSEDPAAIRAEILAAAPGAREIGARDEAINTAVAMMGAGDVLVVAGKGHETGQIIGDRTYPFSDTAAVLAALGEPHDDTRTVHAG